MTLYAHNRAYDSSPGDVKPIDVLAQLGRDRAREYDAGIVLGDRYEMMLAAAQIVEARIPLLHIHGGEHTYGSLDERWRWAMSSMADVHCVAHESAAVTLALHLVDGPRIRVTGAPGLDDILDRHPVKDSPRALVVYNPVIDEATTQHECEAIREAMGKLVGELDDELVRWIEPNGDRYSPKIGIAGVEPELFRDHLAAAHVIVGNSSSGIIEAPSLGTWCVNVGERQRGRVRGDNTVDVPGEPEAIRKAVVEALARPRAPRTNPYAHPDGKASQAIAEVLTGMLD